MGLDPRLAIATPRFLRGSQRGSPTGSGGAASLAARAATPVHPPSPPRRGTRHTALSKPGGDPDQARARASVSRPLPEGISSREGADSPRSVPTPGHSRPVRISLSSQRADAPTHILPGESRRRVDPSPPPHPSQSHGNPPRTHATHPGKKRPADSRKWKPRGEARRPQTCTVLGGRAPPPLRSSTRTCNTLACRVPWVQWSRELER